MPSVVLLRADGDILVGDAANRRAVSEPDRVAREFKRRLGDTTPLFLGGAPWSAEALMGRLLTWVVAQVSAREGGGPERVALTRPANWGEYKLDLLTNAARMADLDQDVLIISEPEAAAIYYATTEKVEPGEVVAVYDLGGGTFDATVLRRTESGFDLLGTPEGIERLGGIDFDAAVFGHVQRSLGGAIEQLDEADPAALSAVARLRADCQDAKEGLSSDTDAVVPVLLPNVQTEVRITRDEFEGMIRPTLEDSIGAMRRALRSAEVDTADVSRVLLVGGSSRIPLVAEMVGAELGRPVAVDAHPKHAVALGAALAATGDASAPAAPVVAAHEGPGDAATPGPGDGVTSHGNRSESDSPGVGAGGIAAAAAAGAAVGASAAVATGAADATGAGAVSPSTSPAEQPTVQVPTEQAASDAGAPGAGPPAGPPPDGGTPGAGALPPATPTGGGTSGSGPADPSEAKGGRGPLIGILAAIVVVVVVAVAWLALSGDSDDDLIAASDTETPDTTEAPAADDEAPTMTEAPDATTPGDDTDGTEGDTEEPAIPCDIDLDEGICITDVEWDGDRLVVSYDTELGLTLAPDPGSLAEGTVHAHFFFNTVPAQQAGTPGAGPWEIWEATPVFDVWTAEEVPPGATQVCVLVADFDHSVRADSGNCAPIPS